MCLFVWTPTKIRTKEAVKNRTNFLILGHIFYHFSKVFFRKISTSIFVPTSFSHLLHHTTPSVWQRPIDWSRFRRGRFKKWLIGAMLDKWLHGMMSNQSSPNIKIAGQGVPDSSLKGVWSVLFSWLSFFKLWDRKIKSFYLTLQTSWLWLAEIMTFDDV